MAPNEPLPEWRTASHGLRVFWVLLIGLWLTGLGAWFAYRYFAADPQIHSTAETVFLVVWAIMACATICERLYRRYWR
jgi:hypothetical protein